MNPNEPQPQSDPTPESTPTPEFTQPSVEQPQSTPPTTGAPVPTSPHQPVKKVVAIVVGTIIALILSLIVSSVVRNALNNEDTTDKTGTTQTTTPATETPKPVAAVAADDLYDYEDVCKKTATISNAAAYEKPYKVAPSYLNAGGTWNTANFSIRSPLATEYDQPETVNVVACLEAVDSTVKKANTCTYKEVAVELYTLEYAVTYINPKTGDVISKSASNVTASSSDCPSFISYKKDDPRFYAVPDRTSLDTVIGAFVNS